MTSRRVPSIPVYGSVAPDSAWSQMERWVGFGNTILTQSQITSIDYFIYDIDDTVFFEIGSHSVSSVIFDTPQTNADDSEWPDTDEVGYNFKVRWTAEQSPPSGKTYRYKHVITDAEGLSYTFLTERTAYVDGSP